MTIAKFETRFGLILAMTNDRPIADSLEAYGEWAQIEIEFLTQFIPDDGVILDCGSHVGIHSLAFARTSERAHVHAIEAQPQLVSLLAQNIAPLGNRIIVHECAVGSDIGAGFIERLPDHQDINAGAQAIQSRADTDSFEVPIRTIDSFHLSGITFIKLDVEGYEAAALRGAAQSIARDKPAIYCEVNSIGAAVELFRVMEGRGYQCYFVSTPTFNPENFWSASANIFGVAHESALLFLPGGRPPPDILRAGVCAPVRDVDEFAPLFFKTPRFGDETSRDRDCVWLKQEMVLDHQDLADARSQVAALKQESIRDRQELAEVRSQVAALKQESVRDRQELADARSQVAALKQESDRDRQELADARGQVAALIQESVRDRQQLTEARTQFDMLERGIEVEKQKYKILAEFVRKSDFAARRRSVIGAAARRFGRSELAKACRTLTDSGLFDRKWYKSAYPGISPSKMEPVAHYILYGAFQGRKPNKVFDSAYYLSENPDVRHSGINPLLHYILYGAREMRRPSADFDPVAYLEAYPSLKGGHTLLLKHFLNNAGVETPVVRPYRPMAPGWSAFETLKRERKKAPSEPALVDVIVPVYRGYEDTLSCIYSVLTSGNATPFELIVIDDASPEPTLSEALRRLAHMGLITLLRNEQNLGFVGTVNRGMALHETRDVLLLNSDTLVFNDWLDRIRAHGLKPDVASVTPFTNNGTICSYPAFCQDNPSELEVTFSQLDQMAARINRDQSVDVPTGVGFCMYITRNALSKIGYFDIETFRKGYGEENDFCVRASESGMRNIHALDVFVFHSGETSFGADASKAKQLGLSRLVAKHPGYLATVQKYIAADPAKKARERLDIARLLKGVPERSVLCFTHTLGGGIERYLLDRAALGRDNGEILLLAIPHAANGAKIRLTAVDGRPALHNLADFDIDADRETLAQLLRPLRMSGIEVHSTVGWSARVLQAIPGIARALGIPFDFMAHDFVPICPQITLIDESGIYCGEDGDAQCRRCLNARTKTQIEVHPDFASAGMRDIVDWRAKYQRFLEQAREVAAPSDDTAKRLHKYFPTIDVVSRPHKEAVDTYARNVAASYSGGTLKVVVIGAIGHHKGSEILRKCAEDAERRRLPIHFAVVGYTNIRDLGDRPNVDVTGAYAEREVFDRLAEVGAHVALLPSVWPETYCYTLTIAMKAGFPVCAFDIGAPAERLRARADSILLPASMMTDASGINDSLLAMIAMRGYKVTVHA